MCKRIINLFKKESKEKTFVEKIKDIPLHKTYLLDLKAILLETGFDNINSLKGEFVNIDGKESDECCIDVFFEKDYLYMLTIYSDGILLLKNKHQLQKDVNDYSYEDVEYEDVFRINLKKSILPLIYENQL